MTWKRVLLVVGALVLAFALQDLVRLALVIPLAYIWWVFELLFGSVPQVVLWGIFVFLIAILLFNSLTTRIVRPRLAREKVKPHLGSVETLARSIARSREGIYGKWQIANRLGRLARDFLILQGERVNIKDRSPLSGRDWHPSESVDAYLDTGYLGSFADIPNRKTWRFRAPKPTPLDIDVNDVVEFLESHIRKN